MLDRGSSRKGIPSENGRRQAEGLHPRAANETYRGERISTLFSFFFLSSIMRLDERRTKRQEILSGNALRIIYSDTSPISIR